MFSKIILATFTAAAALGVQAQLVQVPLDVTLDVGTAATCPADAPEGTDVEATVLAVVTLNTVLEAELAVLGLGLTGADISADVDVCLCVDATVGVDAITLPVNLEAAVQEDLTNLVEGLDLDVTIPGVAGGLNSLLENPLTQLSLTTSGESIQPCNCPEGAQPICSNAQCSCQCPTGFFYNAVTQECILAGSGLARKVRRHPVFDTRQAKRAEVVARLARS